MMQDIDTLLVIAEIAGVFVGFTALEIVVAGRIDTESQYDDTFRLLHVRDAAHQGPYKMIATGIDGRRRRRGVRVP